MSSELVEITYKEGSLIIENLPKSLQHLQIVYDERLNKHIALAAYYMELILELTKHNIAYTDKARKYNKITLGLKEKITPRKHQQEALNAWSLAQQRGFVSLPTGSGKTILAIMAMAQAKRSTLIVVPTIDLMNQWHDVLSKYFSTPIGRLGGGLKDYQEILVSTYDSARMIVEHKGSEFGFLIVD